MLPPRGMIRQKYPWADRVKKMTCLGFKTLVIKWFNAYLSNKILLVSVDDVFLEAEILNYVAPQKSIHVSLQLLIYVNALPQSLFIIRK